MFFRAAGYVTNLNESKPMSKTKLNIIQPSLGLVRLSDGDLLSRTNALHDGMVDNTAYPSPPVSMRDFKAALDAYTAAVAATLDGGKSATAERDKCRAEVIIMLRLLAHYVEGARKNDMATFLLCSAEHNWNYVLFPVMWCSMLNSLVGGALSRF